MMRVKLAILSDIHGNPIALDAVLADIKAQGGVDGYWVLGDLAALGFDPLGSLERVAAMPNVRFVRGNTDRYVVTGERPLSLVDAARGDAGAFQRALDIYTGFSWTQGYITPRGWLDWLAALPLEQRLVLPDGTRLLGVHAAPGTDDGAGIHPGLSPAELQALVADAGVDLICVGHTHWQMEAIAGNVRVVNLGSVSNQPAPDLRASYYLLEADTFGYKLENRRVDYNHESVIAALQKSRYPGADYIIRFQRGENQAAWKSKVKG